MKFPSNSTFSDEEVQSGSATGFSDGEREEMSKASHRMKNAFDPVTQILDKIDAELVSLTRSQGSSSTATTGTDNTVIRRPDSRMSLESSRQGNGESLSLSQLGANFKPSVSLHSEQDTGIGTSSLPDSSLQHRSLEPEVRPLEPGDSYRGDSYREDPGGKHRRSATSPEMLYLNGHHMSDDDKQKRENQTASPFEAKHVDDKFKEILQKRKGGFLRNVDDDTQTIRTEDFVDKFQDTLVYSSADEAEKLRNIEDDLHSDGGSDTDTLQRKLAILTRTPIYNMNNTRDGGTRPLPRPKKKLTSSLEIRPRKAAAPGTPPVYPKPTPTTSLPRPSMRSSLKINQGHVSDADSVRTEDFEHKFQDMMVNPGNRKEDSDMESVSNDPIHTKVKQLLKATAKYKPKPDYKNKPHVRISPKPVQYENEDKGDDSDDTLCSDKHATVSSYRTLVEWNPAQSYWNTNYSSHWVNNHHRVISESPSLDDSLSKSSSLSLSSLSSSDKEKTYWKVNRLNNESTSASDNDGKPIPASFSRQVSQVSNTTSLPSWSGSELPNSTSVSQFTSTEESIFDDGSVSVPGKSDCNKTNFKDYQYSDIVGPTRRRSSLSDILLSAPYSSKKSGEDTMKTNREKRKHRDIIVQDDEEEPYPFAKYTFNKKSEKAKTDDSMSTVSSMSTRSSSQESIFSVGLMKQYVTLKNGKMPIMNKRSSTSSMMSSQTSSFNDPSVASFSAEDNSASQDYESFEQDARMKASKVQYRKSPPNLFLKIPPAPIQNPYNYQMYNFPQVPAPSPEQLLNSMGFNEAQSILPERFLKSWIEKALQTQQQEYMRYMMSAPQPPPPVVSSSFYDNPYYVDDSDLPPSISAQQSVVTTPQYHSSLENLHGAAKLFQQSHSRFQEKSFQRSNTFNSSLQSLNRSKMNGFLGNDDDDVYPSRDDCDASDLSSIGALPLKKENSFDKLKRILHSSIPFQQKSFRRSAFAANHQKSLPISLETLTEEDEEKKRSRTPSFDRNSTKSNGASKMRSFLEEEEKNASRGYSSDNSSDLSHHSSFSGPGEAVMQLSKERCLCSESKDKCKCFSPVEDETESVTEEVNQNENFKMNIPSIIVSEKEVPDEDATDRKKQNSSQKSENEARNESFLPVIVEEACSSASSERFSRPSSPNPDTQDECTAYSQGHNYEIAEIMDRRNSQDKGRKLTGPRRGSKEYENFSFEVHATKPGQFLSISTSDLDDKHLSPTPSLSSPNVMSPITVIEVNKLDNQNDSLELDDNKTSEQIGSRHNSAGTTDSRSQTGTGNHAKFHGKKDLISHKSCQKRKKSRKHQTPKCLTLKRHFNNCDTLSGKESTSDSENVFLDLSVAVEENEKSEIEIQADDDSLCPIIILSDVADLLHQLSQSLPELIEKPVFVLAHDRAIQCNIQCEKDSNARMNDGVFFTEKQLQINEAPNYFSFHVPLNHIDIENELHESDHSDGSKMTDNFCQTAESDITSVGSHVKLNRPPFRISPVPMVRSPPERSYLSVNNFFVDNFEEVKVSIQVPGVFKSEKTIALKHKQTVDKVLPIVNCDNGESDTSLRCEQMVVITETSSDINSERNELGNIAVNTTDCNKCFNNLHISPERDSKLYISTFIHHGSSDSLESKRYGNESESRSTTLADQVEVEISLDGTREGKKYERNEKDKCEVVNRNKASSGSVLKLVDERDTSLSDFSLNGMNHKNKRRCIRSYESNVNNENHVNNENNTNSVNEKNEGKHEIDYFTEESRIKEAQVYHSECYIYPKVEGIKDVSDCGLGSNLKDKYICSVFMKLETPNLNTCRETLNELYKNKFHFSTSYNSSEEGGKGSEGGLSISHDYGSQSRESKIFEKDTFSDSDQEFVKKRDKSMQNNENSSEDSTDPYKEGYLYKDIELQRLTKGNGDSKDNKGNSVKMEDNISHEGKTDEAGNERKSKVRKDNLLRKFRALIGQRVDEVENVGTSSNEFVTQYESRDPKSQVISTRSLDFETIGSRKNILHRCLKTGFAKSFDVSGIDLNTVQHKDSTNVENNQIINSNSSDLCIMIDENEKQPACITDRTDKVSPNSLIDSDVEKSEYKETEFEIRDYYQSDECDKVMYQVGLNYNDDKKCYDVYGRVKIFREDRPVAFNKDSNAEKEGVTEDINERMLNDVFCLSEANVMKLISGEMQEMADNNPIDNILTELNKSKEERQKLRQNDIKDLGLGSVDVKNGNQHFEEQKSKTNLEPSKRPSERKIFDMFQQVRDDDEDSVQNDSEFGPVKCQDDKNNFNEDHYIDDVRMKKTLEKIERLYSLSVYDQNNIPEHFEMDMTEGDVLYENGNDIDSEMKLLDSYYDEYGLTETHTCRNCGHSVTMETSGRYDVGEVFEHDFCCKCSPLKFTVEMLESRRIQRMNVENDCFNQIC